MRHKLTVSLFLISCVAFYPIYILLVFLLDSTLGASLLWHSIFYESWKNTAVLLITDWLRSIPASAVISATVIVPTVLIHTNRSLFETTVFFTLVTITYVVASHLITIPVSAVALAITSSIMLCVLLRLYFLRAGKR